MKKVFFFLSFFLWSSVLSLFAQRVLTPMEQDTGNHWEVEADSVEKENVPYSIYTWRLGGRFGDIITTQPDTSLYLFMNEAFSVGKQGEYNSTGNLGAPRQSRIFWKKKAAFNQNSFLFAAPYDYFLTQPYEFLFTNTKSPFTNLTYHSAGDRLNGEDRFRALFATNVNKNLGVGFKVDYLYGRGEFAAQANSQFNVTFYGSYIGEKYSSHVFYSNNRVKNAENGGLEDDAYILHPENFSTSFGNPDIPTRLSKTYNKMHLNTLFFTQRYHLGFRRYYDEEGNIVHRRTQQEGGGKLLNKMAHGVEMGSTEAARNDTPKDSAEEVFLRPEFVPVIGLLHTFRLDHSNRQFIYNARKNTYFAENFLLGDSALDVTNYWSIENTFAVEVYEGFSKWVKSGLRLFARHHLERFDLPNTLRKQQYSTQNRFNIGAQLYRKQGKFFHYDILGEIRTSGTKWGEFNIEGNARFRLPLLSDTLQLHTFGYLRNQEPTFYYRHFHSKNAWWDHAALSNIFNTQMGGTVSYKNYRATVAVENIKNTTYFQEKKTPFGCQGLSLYGINVEQEASNIQVLSVALAKKLNAGILNWETELTYQLSSNKRILPLPLLNLYSNLYLDFRIVKVLRANIGTDIRYFTQYNAPSYSPIIGHYALQAQASPIAIGNYPIINAYANFQLKRTRFYVMVSHLNYSKGSGHPFLVPHHPLTSMAIRFGVSWNFIN